MEKHVAVDGLLCVAYLAHLEAQQGGSEAYNIAVKVYRDIPRAYCEECARKRGLIW